MRLLAMTLLPMMRTSTKWQRSPCYIRSGAYGLEQPVSETPTVLFRGATVWTCEDDGVLKDADVLIRDGRIAAIGKGLVAPPLCSVQNAKGKHITPGLIDCHSHMGTDGGVNESGQVVTAEVRIGDFIDNSDISIYRQLAGGLTTSQHLARIGQPDRRPKPSHQATLGTEHGWIANGRSPQWN